MESARALAHKKDDRLRKEFEKWAILTYTNNRAAIHQKFGADGGIDGVVYFQQASGLGLGKMVLQAKSGHVERKDIAALRGDLDQQRATIAGLITLEKPSKPMVDYAKSAGRYTNTFTGQAVDNIQIIEVADLIEKRPPVRFEMPLDLAAIKREVLETEGQLDLEFDAPKTEAKKRARKPPDNVTEFDETLFSRKRK